MSEQLICTIPENITSYPIEIQYGLLDNIPLLKLMLEKLASRFAIVADWQVAGYYGKDLCDNLNSAGLDVDLFIFPSGEINKNRTVKEKIEDQLFKKNFGSDSCIIALGGGVTTDLGGYVAATYCRGIPLVNIPTSLLGMVDASIGGKNGVNVPYGKNLLGCIYQPKMVLIDSVTLRTLRVEELRNGFVEMIKHGVIADDTYFAFLSDNIDKLLSLDSETIERAIYESCRIKKEIVEQNEKESRKRHLLNFGHTIGHALEHLTHFSISHGEAVAIGMLVESHLAIQLGKLKQKDFDRLKSILLRYGLLLKLEEKFSVEALLEAMILDKKSKKGAPRFVLIESIGVPDSCDSEYCTVVKQDVLVKTLEWMIKVFSNSGTA